MYYSSCACPGSAIFEAIFIIIFGRASLLSTPYSNV